MVRYGGAIERYGGAVERYGGAVETVRQYRRVYAVLMKFL